MNFTLKTCIYILIVYVVNSQRSDIILETLEIFYNSTDGDQWLNNTGWLQDENYCFWYGIECKAGNITSNNFFFSLIWSINFSLDCFELQICSAQCFI